MLLSKTNSAWFNGLRPQKLYTINYTYVFWIKILQKIHKYPEWLLKQLRVKSNTKTNSMFSSILLRFRDNQTEHRSLFSKFHYSNFWNIKVSYTVRNSKKCYELTTEKYLILRPNCTKSENPDFPSFSSDFLATKQGTKFVTYKHRDKQLRSVQFRNVTELQKANPMKSEYKSNRKPTDLLANLIN